MKRRNKKNPYIYWEEISDTKIIYIYFEGVYKKEHAEITIERTVSLVEANRPNKSSLVFDCLKVTNYDKIVRTMIYESIKEYRSDLDDLYMIADSPLIIAAAEIVSFFSSYNIHVVKSLKELEKVIKKNNEGTV